MTETDQVLASAPAFEPPTAPSASNADVAKLGYLERVDPLDISGSWVTSEFLYAATLPGTDGRVRCESYALIENDEWNSVLLERNHSLPDGSASLGRAVLGGRAIRLVDDDRSFLLAGPFGTAVLHRLPVGACHSRSVDNSVRDPARVT